MAIKALLTNDGNGRARVWRTWVGALASALFALGCVANAGASDGDAGDGGLDTPPPSLGEGGPSSGDPLASDASLGLRASQVFAGCQGGPETACHGAGVAGLHLRLGPGGDVVDVSSTERPSMLRVAPGNPLASYLFLKVLGDGGIEGGQMPLGGPYDARLPLFIASWIEAGAPSPDSPRP